MGGGGGAVWWWWWFVGDEPPPPPNSATTRIANPLFQDFRLGDVDAPRFVALLQVVDPGLLGEFTTGGRPTGATPLHLLVSGKDKELERVEIIKEMLRLSASPSLKMRSNGASPLHRAAGTGAKHIVQELLSARAHVNAVNNAGATPLDACYRSSGEAATFINLFNSI